MSKLYGAYRFKSKDPAIDEIRTLVEDYFGRRVNSKDLTSVKEAGGPTAGTMARGFLERQSVRRVRPSKPPVAPSDTKGSGGR